MALMYRENGLLVPGIHQMTWNEFVQEFGVNSHRLNQINGLRMALVDLKSVGCTRAYVDGSFVTKKLLPSDYDACWDVGGVDLARLQNEFPLFFDFSNGRARQKAYYKGELMPAQIAAKLNPIVFYINFFQQDRDGNPKGIVSLLLQNDNTLI